MDTRELQVVSGAVIAFRLFDIADSIDLTKAETLWRQQLRSAASRGRLASTPPKAVAFGVPPLDISLEPVTVRLASGEAQATVTVRLYDFGLARLALRFGADDLPWPAFSRRLNEVDGAVGPAARNKLWETSLEQVRTASPVPWSAPRSRRWRRTISSASCAPSTRRRTRTRCCSGSTWCRCCRGRSGTLRRRPPRSVAATIFLLHRRSGRSDLGSSVRL